MLENIIFVILFQASASEVLQIAKSFTQMPNPLAGVGIKLGPMKFMFLRCEDPTLFGKKKGIGALCIYKSKTGEVKVEKLGSELKG